MSDNPEIDSILKNMEALWDQAFIMAKRIVERHVPVDADDRIRNEYIASVPAMANTLCHDLLSASGFIAGSNSKDIEGHIQTTNHLLHELRVRNKVKKDDEG